MSIHEILEIKKHQIVDHTEVGLLSRNTKTKIILPLGPRNFNDILEGGFYSGKKYVIFGPNNTGKTQICHQLCVHAYEKFHKIFNSQNTKFIYYLDTENTFRPERIEELLVPLDHEIEEVLRSILISKIMSNSVLLLALKDFEKIMLKEAGGILIIDTINNHFRSDLGNKNIVFQSAKEKFLKILKKIDELTKKFNLITILTSQVTTNFSRGAIIRELPVGYQFLNHYCSEFIYLSKKNNEKNFAHLVNSLSHPEKKVLYNITSEGIQDYKI
ncbi:MAG: hypothetical protein ACW98D_00310 [Promethearchaeota archaeon]|jgi:RecA/RadA recombinase